jgi:hypothetical protein
VGDYFAADATRPLAIVNTDNRLIASAYRLRWEPILEPWVSIMQQGFLQGRSMLSNIVDIDFEAMRVSLQYKAGAIVLFDFRAAFPSVSHTYIMKVLHHLGFPKTALALVTALYNQNRCLISCHGSLYPGFDVKAGIRQGCPLSPLLFAVVVDMLLRRLAAFLPDAVCRAFADDTAVVLQDLRGVAGILNSVFTEFGHISGLRLNLPKTVVIPLWPESLPEIRTRFLTDFPEWEGVAVTSWSKYLGYATGPGKQESSWTKAGETFLERARFWGGQGLGLQYATHAYNSYAVSVLSFVSQLEAPPASILCKERQALRQVAKGPGAWAIAEDLWHLHECYGQARSFRSVEVQALAAQARVARFELESKGGLRINTRAQALRHLLNTGEYVGRRIPWKDWYERSHVLLLDGALARLNSQGISTDDITAQLSNKALKPWSLDVARRVKRGFQKAVARAL